MVEVKDITGMIEGALTQIINAKVEEEKAKIGRDFVVDFLKQCTADDVRSIMTECNVQTIECLQLEDIPTELKEQAAHDWISDNPNEALSEALEQGADTEDVASDWISDNPEDAFDKAVDNMGTWNLKDKIKDAIDNL